jgi:hypothetical protein
MVLTRAVCAPAEDAKRCTTRHRAELGGWGAIFLGGMSAWKLDGRKPLEVAWMHMDVFRMQRAQDNTRGGLTFGTRWSGLRPVLKSFVCGHTTDACSCDLRGAHATSKAGVGSHGLQCVCMTYTVVGWMDVDVCGC